MLLGFLLAMSTPVQAQQSTETPSPTLARWEHVGGDDKGQFSIDPQTMQWTGRRVRVFVRLHLKGEGADEPIIGVMRYVYDCTAHTARVEQIDVFDTEGKLQFSNPTELFDQKDEPIEDGTPNDVVTKRVCG